MMALPSDWPNQLPRRLLLDPFGRIHRSISPKPVRCRARTAPESGVAA